MVSSDRQYDIILLGATGYTGKFCAEYIAQNFPTDIKWAIAGRNAKKLAAVAQDLKALNPDRDPPGTEVAELSAPDLDNLVRKTRLLVTTVGPYNLYGTPAFEACAKNGTHYVDCTGEIPWYREMLGRFQSAALDSGAIMIPQAGFDSVPSDITTWMIVNQIHKKLHTGTANVLHTVQNIKGGASGGTIATILSMLDTYSLKWLNESRNPYCISPIPRPVVTGTDYPDLFSKVLGIRRHPNLGILTDTPQAMSNIPLVYRSWGLLGPKLYGEKFHFSDWMRAKTIISGTLWHFVMMFAGFALIFKPFRMLLRKLVTQPGFGPDADGRKDNFVYVKSIGYADEPRKRRVQSVMKYTGDMYTLTALLMMETAFVMLKEQDTEAHRLRGVVTPATLGQPYVERLRKAGVTLTVEMLD